MSVTTKKFGNDANNRIFVRLNTDPLEKMEKELGKYFVAQVGVLGIKAAGRLTIKNEEVGGKSGNKKVPVVQGESGLSNADIGLIHEKGSPLNNIPRRSFLEVPLTMKMPGLMDKVGRALVDGLENTGIEVAYKKLASYAEGIVSQAFPTQGYGRWPNKSNGEPSHLIKTAQLRQSIASRVVSK